MAALGARTFGFKETLLIEWARLLPLQVRTADFLREVFLRCAIHQERVSGHYCARVDERVGWVPTSHFKFLSRIENVCGGLAPNTLPDRLAEPTQSDRERENL